MRIRKDDFETMLTVGIASHRLALVRELNSRDKFYSSEMYEAEEPDKVYLLELFEHHFVLCSDLVFDNSVGRFFYVTKEKFEYSEESLKDTLQTLRRTERRIYEILSKLKLRGFFTRNEFIRSLIGLVPQLEWNDDVVADRKSGKVFITVKRNVLHLVYQDGKSSNFLDLAKKDLNEKVLSQCAQLIKASFKYER
ncbi:MAG: hypothetical protein FWF67_02100 [Fibromonadales bacterium]|nr:hypothetical protein [Fibromonadales bacterium]